VSRFSSNFDAVNRAIGEALVEGSNATLIAASRLLRKTLSQKGTGRIYRIGKGRRKGRNLRAKGFHQASAPGQPPAVNTNRLRQSWAVSPVTGGGRSQNAEGAFAQVSQGERRVVLQFGSSLFYAPLLEYGTARMKARPYLAPTIPVLDSIAPKLFAAAMQRRLRK
jgi:hypothetical protein